MKMLYKKTNKLFYKKWPFKVACFIRGANRLKFFGGVDATIDWCNDTTATEYATTWNRNLIDKPKLLKFAKTIKPYLEQDIQTRAEGGHFNIFCKDQDLLDSMVRDLSPWITEVYEPTEDDVYNYLLNTSGNKVVCEVYPFNGYQFKVFLKDQMSSEVKANFLTWIIKYKGKIRIADSSLLWMVGSKRWMQDPFIYVKDRSTLTMVLLFLGNDCKRTQEYILKSSINTPCPH